MGFKRKLECGWGMDMDTNTNMDMVTKKLMGMLNKLSMVDFSFIVKYWDLVLWFREFSRRRTTKLQKI